MTMIYYYVHQAPRRICFSQGEGRGVGVGGTGHDYFSCHFALILFPFRTDLGTHIYQAYLNSESVFEERVTHTSSTLSLRRD